MQTTPRLSVIHRLALNLVIVLRFLAGLFVAAAACSDTILSMVIMLVAAAAAFGLSVLVDGGRA